MGKLHDGRTALEVPGSHHPLQGLNRFRFHHSGPESHQGLTKISLPGLVFPGCHGFVQGKGDVPGSHRGESRGRIARGVATSSGSISSSRVAPGKLVIGPAAKDLAGPTPGGFCRSWAFGGVQKSPSMAHEHRQIGPPGQGTRGAPPITRSPGRTGTIGG